MNKDIFEFRNDIEYTIVLEGSIQLTGYILDTYSNGIELEDHTMIPQDKILFFRPFLGTDSE